MKLTKEQYERLTPYKQQLRSAYKNSFLHMSGTDFNKVAEIYNEVYDKPLTRSQMNCNTCRLNSLKKLGQLYEEYTEQTETEKKKSPNKGRPKKLVDEKKDGDGSNAGQDR